MASTRGATRLLLQHSRDATAPRFSADGRRLAYVASAGGKWFVVVDGEDQTPYDAIVVPSLQFSLSGQRVAYVAQMGSKLLAIVDGREGKQYDGIGALAFSPDSRRVAFIARIGDKCFAVVDGAEDKEYSEVADFVFSPDSQRLAYVAEVRHWQIGPIRRRDQLIVVDGEATPIDGSFVDYNVAFSPDSRHVAYAVGKGFKSVVVVDGYEGDEYDFIVTIGGGRLVFDSPNSFHYMAGKAGSFYLVEETIK